VPALTYGGPDAAPDTPSPASKKLAESAVILEFIADIAPEAELLPKDPVLRANARFFADSVTTKFNSEAYRPALAGTGDLEAILGAVDFIQQLLPEEGYAVGKWSIADAAVTPFLARAEVALKDDIGKYEEGKGKAIWAKLETDPKYARFRKYFADVKARDSFKETFYAVSFFV
jgi:glutathione S-transferase